MNTLMLFAVDILKIGLVIYVAKFGLMAMSRLFRQLTKKLDEVDIFASIFPATKKGRHEAENGNIDENFVNDREA